MWEKRQSCLCNCVCCPPSFQRTWRCPRYTQTCCQTSRENQANGKVIFSLTAANLCILQYCTKKFWVWKQATKIYFCRVSWHFVNYPKHRNEWLHNVKVRFRLGLKMLRMTAKFCIISSTQKTHLPKVFHHLRRENDVFVVLVHVKRSQIWISGKFWRVPGGDCVLTD